MTITRVSEWVVLTGINNGSVSPSSGKHRSTGSPVNLSGAHVIHDGR